MRNSEFAHLLKSIDGRRSPVEEDFKSWYLDPAPLGVELFLQFTGLKIKKEFSHSDRVTRQYQTHIKAKAPSPKKEAGVCQEETISPQEEESFVTFSDLNLEQKLALDWMNERSKHSLDREGFSQSQLKSLYRDLVKTLHPDVGGKKTTESFLTLVSCFEIVDTIFEDLPKETTL